MSATMNLRTARARAVARRRKREAEYARIFATCLGDAVQRASMTHDAELKYPEARH